MSVTSLKRAWSDFLAMEYPVVCFETRRLYQVTHFEVVGEENTGHVDYEIKAFERFILSWKGNHMRWDLNLIQCESALQINKTDNDFKDEFDYIYGRHTAWRVCLEKGFGEKKYW
uniref:Uncharacterized protein n=1 Tax=Rhizophagus irregularis (strain DAOM 181602 / DAOM 197198 / MUCL 43194) TaxID=747089 RepID=U9SW88_RHIID